MYDARQEPNEFIADSLEEARSHAADFFETDVENLRIVVAKAGEIFGAGGRSVIVAVPKDLAGRPSRSSSGSGDEERGGERSSRRESRGGSRDRERGGRGDRGDRGERSERAPRGRSEREGRGRSDRGERNDRGSERGAARGESRRGEREQLKQEPQAAVADSKGKAQGKIGPIGDFLLGALERMKLGSFEISESSEGEFLIYQLRGAAAQALQSGDGRATDALQLVANQVSMRLSEDAPRIVVDVEGGGDERDDTLTRLAERAVKRARETGRSIALDPMNSRDRRSIHIAIRDEDGVATMSIGEGRYRQVLVVPEGAPEYEDALAES